jgi:type I restriction enzyme S subunit
MSTAWRQTTVQEFVDRGEAELKTGPFGTQLHASDYVKNGTPVINVRNIGFGSIVPEKLEFIGEETVARLRGHLLQPGDIVFGRKGAVERHVLIKDQQHHWFQGSDCLRLRLSSPELSRRFLSYSLLTDSHKQWMMNQCSHGATMASLNQAIICRIPLRLPDIKTQEKIGSILAAYDDLIENNTRRIKVLEEMAEIIYRDWFVLLRFPGHEKVEMLESEWGRLPDTWRLVTLEDVVEEIIDYRGKTPKKLGGLWAERGVLALSALNVKQGRLENLDKAKFVSEDLYRKWMKSELRSGDILMTSEAPLGEVYFLPATRQYCLSQRVFSIRANPVEISPAVLYLFLSSQSGQKQIRARASGTTVLGIRQADLRRIPLIQPDLATQQKAEAILLPFLREIDVLHRQVANIRQTRDFLLPKLISGEVNAEKLEVEVIVQSV